MITMTSPVVMNSAVCENGGEYKGRAAGCQETLFLCLVSSHMSGESPLIPPPAREIHDNEHEADGG
ncbi:MAG: hypothetical protein NT072_00560, partial [Deltaproteobacteria bacterium]|nr:hypothetical protein [Deltaproteobacteria bacterium]